MTTVLTTRRAATAIILAAVAASAACSPGETGEANPEPAAPATSSAPSATTEPDAGGESSLAQIEACSLLSPDELSKYGNFPEGEVKNVGPARGCSFQRDREVSEAGRQISVTIRENAGVDEVNDMGMGIDTTQANGRDIARVPDSGGCMIALGVTDSSRVDVLTIADEGTDKSCEIADEIAVTVEAKLPRS